MAFGFRRDCFLVCIKCVSRDVRVCVSPDVLSSRSRPRIKGAVFQLNLVSVLEERLSPHCCAQVNSLAVSVVPGPQHVPRLLTREQGAGVGYLPLLGQCPQAEVGTALSPRGPA